MTEAPETPRFPSVDDAVSALLGEGARLRSRTPVGGGCINACAKLTFEDGRSLFLKENGANFPGMFAAEAKGLRALRCPEGPRVPEALAWGENEKGQFLVMEWIPAGKAPRGWAENFGRALARLHARPMPFWGFPGDNYIGSTPQINARADDWTGFFAEHRLGYQVRLARSRGLLDSRTALRAERVMARLPNWLSGAADYPSVVHGDLWSGNLMVGPGGEAVIVDPACYFGHRETDLAMTELFGRMEEGFYKAYDEILPRPPGYPERREIYNLYHLLNHLNLFGASYRSGVEEILDAFA
ncbi:MAG: fructosamine kinase family protein [Spirochaetes bacterium]|nr:fructosamine kinase family protein [Spirochaetota bacterium]